VFENRVLRRIYGPKRDEVTGSGENYITMTLMICIVHQIYSGDQLKKNEMGGACSAYGGERRRIQDFGEGKRPLGRTRRRWKDNTKMELQEVGCGV